MLARCFPPQIALATFLVASSSLPVQHAVGQIIVGPEKRIDLPNPHTGLEPDIGIAPSIGAETMEAVAGAIDWRNWDGFSSQPQQSIALTFNGAATWPTTEQGIINLPGLPTSDEWGLDGQFWGNRSTGDVWMVAIGGTMTTGTGGRVVAIKRTPGMHFASLPLATFLTPLWPTQSADEHLPEMTSGPSPGPIPQTTHYIVFKRFIDTMETCQGQFQQCFFGEDEHVTLLRSTNDGATWSEFNVKPLVCPPGGFPQCEYNGKPTDVIVIDRGPWRGTVVVLIQSQRGLTPNVVSDYYAVWSNDSGQTWPLFDDRKSFFSNTLHALDQGGSTDPTIEVPGNLRLPIHTDAALDPVTGDIFIVVAGKQIPGTNAQARNMDLYLVRGRTNNPSTPITFDPPINLNLDFLSGTAMDGPDQFMPSIAIDDLGGINLIYYDTQHNHVVDSTSHAFMDAYYARVTNLGLSSQNVFTSRLTTHSFCSECDKNCVGCPPCPYEEDPTSLVTSEFIGDYLGIDALGCDVYVTYMSTRPANKRHYFSRRIEICAADADSNLVVDGNDPLQFQAEFGSGKLSADLNQDGTVDASDMLIFTDQFLAAPK